MKKFAKLILYFSIVFVILFLVSGSLMYLASWITMARIIPLGTEPGQSAADLAWKILPIALHGTMLLGLSYAVRKKVPGPLAILCVFLLGCGFTVGISLGISRIEVLKVALKPVSPMVGRPGLILNQSDNAVILLKASSDILGPRVVSIPGLPLIYHETPTGPNNTIISLPALPFINNTPWFLRSLGIDLSLSGREMESRMEADFFSFAVYAVSVVLLLASLRFILALSKWPLANIFMGALIFRLILLLETFINNAEINTLIGSFLGGRIPSVYITPVIFGVLGILIIVNTLLIWLARSLRPFPSEDEYE